MNETTCSGYVMSDGTFLDLISYITCLLKRSVLPFLVALAVVGFVYGVIQYFIYSDNEAKRKKGADFMLWGIIALFSIVCIWGLVSLLSNSVGVDAVIPQIQVE